MTRPWMTASLPGLLHSIFGRRRYYENNPWKMNRKEPKRRSFVSSIFGTFWALFWVGFGLSWVFPELRAVYSQLFAAIPQLLLGVVNLLRSLLGTVSPA